eukprot:819474-Pelagomonas_calceolata.AAC.2
MGRMGPEKRLGCYNYFISAIGQRLDQQMLGWGSADLDAMEGDDRQGSLCFPSTLPEERGEEQPSLENAVEPVAHTASEDVRIEFMA